MVNILVGETMKKARNNKKNENIQVKENIELVNEKEDMVDDILKDDTEGTMESDTEATELKEWDVADDDEIHEFLSRDLDVVNRTRQRLREKQEAKERLAEQKKEKKPKKVKEPKEPKQPKRPKTSDRLPREKNESKEKMDNKPKSDKNPLEGIIIFVKNIWSKWLDFYHKKTMPVLYGSLGVLVTLLLVAIVVTNMGGSKPANTDEKTSTKEQESESLEEPTTPSEEDGLVAEATDSEIHKIVASYFDALYVQANIDEVGKYVDNVTNFNADRLKSYDKYYESVSNIQCYKFETARVEKSYVVFVTYGIKLYNIETTVPNGTALVVKQDSEGKYLIHNLTDQEILDLKISNEDYIKHIDELEKQVNKALEQVLATDAEFKEVYELMQGLANKATEQTTSDSPSEGETTTEAQG